MMPPILANLQNLNKGFWQSFFLCWSWTACSVRLCLLHFCARVTKRGGKQTSTRGRRNPGASCGSAGVGGKQGHIDILQRGFILLLQESNNLRYWNPLNIRTNVQELECWVEEKPLCLALYTPLEVLSYCFKRGFILLLQESNKLRYWRCKARSGSHCSLLALSFRESFQLQHKQRFSFHFIQNKSRPSCSDFGLII